MSPADGVDGFLELLAGRNDDGSEDDRLYELCNSIQNIVNSYDDEFDNLTELVQNALDALQARLEGDPDWSAPLEVVVTIDADSGTLTVKDNGSGIAWNHRSMAVRPNYSLKRRLGQRTSRGEKGAALTFLQFGHDGIRLQTAHVDGDHWMYTLNGGRRWYEQTVEVLDSDMPPDEKARALPSIDFEVEQLPDSSSPGTTVELKLPAGIFDRILGVEDAVARLRLEYLLRTRTGIGFFVMDGNRENLESWQKKLKVKARIIRDGQTTRFDVPTGFFYPHELAKRGGSRKAGLMTGTAVNNELIYEFFDSDWLLKHVPDALTRTDVQDAVAKYDIRGYVSYANQNDWYETTTGALLSFAVDDASADLQESLIQVNGGFLVSVRGFPTGRRKQFLHRSGAEHKSRTFVVLEFGVKYKPDYGRKNLAADAHPMVLELCKKLIANASARRTMLLKPKGQSTHASQSVDDARQTLGDTAVALRAKGVWMESGTQQASRSPETEMEVVIAFLAHVTTAQLPGFQIMGLLAKGMLDGFFDYNLEVDEAYQFSESAPLGVAFREGRARRYSSEWLEFKTTSDKLVEDFKKPVGESSKKFFSLTNLLVCERVDDATDDYEMVPIDEENYDERKYFGVTHLLRSSKNSEHVVQVISLSDLRSTLNVTPDEIGASGSVEPD